MKIAYTYPHFRRFSRVCSCQHRHDVVFVYIPELVALVSISPFAGIGILSVNHILP
jgi:hypothetical protein